MSSAFSYSHASGFTIVEAVVALAITAIAGSALLLGVESSTQLANHAVEQVIAQGMAEQLMDEIVGTRYMAVGASPYQVPFCPSAWELVTGTRERFDDIDDFHGWNSQPPEDRFGVALGTEDGKGGQRAPAFRIQEGRFTHWQQQISVTYANPNNLSQSLPAGQTSDYRAVEVRIILNDPRNGPRPLATLRRVVAYVPSL